MAEGDAAVTGVAMDAPAAQGAVTAPAATAAAAAPATSAGAEGVGMGRSEKQMAAKAYLVEKVQPVLSEALSQLAKATPEDPVQFVIDYVRKNNPNAPPPPKPKVVFVLGGPGSGKGTQCAKIVSDFGWDHVSAGDLLRDEVQSKSPEGVMIGEMIRNGQIVPGHITVGLLKKSIERSSAAGVLVDGFPRKIDQAGMFESMVCLAEFVLFFDCPEEVMEKRLLERGKTSGRSDDNIKSIKKRFKTFVDQSMPVVAYYEAKDMVHKVDATMTVDQVYARVAKYFSETTPKTGAAAGQAVPGTAPHADLDNSTPAVTSAAEPIADAPLAPAGPADPVATS